MVDQIAAGTQLPVIGRSEDDEWWQVLNATGRECWIYFEKCNNNGISVVCLLGRRLLHESFELFCCRSNLPAWTQKIYTVTWSWSSSGGGETAFRLYRDGSG